MRVLLVTSFFPPDRGGVPVHAAALVRELRALGHEVEVFRRVGDPGEEYASRSEVEGDVRIHSIRYRWRDLDSFERAIRLPRIEEAFAAVLDVVEPDVVHALHLTGLGIGLPRVARERGVPFVLTLMDFWLGCPRSQRIDPSLLLCPTIDRRRCLPCLRALYGGLIPDGPAGMDLLGRYDAAVRGALLECAALVAPSRFVREAYAAEGIPRERISVIPLGIDPAEARSPSREPSDRFRIAYLGTVLLTKGAHVLLEAARRLPRERIRVSIHGEEAPWHEVQDYADRLRASLGPDEPVAFTGAYDPGDVPRLLADADCLVVPSIWFETYSITIREGWRAGLPVVASRLGAMEEAIEDGRTGLLFRPGDSEDLAAKLRSLMDDPGLRGRLASAPKSIPTAAETAERLHSLYASLG
ncbi:MAG TPA: glycosyltransferase family 4 protein [Planctomycetota bacterium]|nr:glycosyltransferase family 4 protein [Planctomycetota bacterium]